MWDNSTHLINHPHGVLQFDRLHRHHSAVSNNRILMVSGTNRTLYSQDLNSLSPIPTHPFSPFRWREGNISIINSCNGFLLINKHTGPSLVMLNPSNRTYIEILLPDFKYKVVGFGFDDLSDNYKIVLVWEDPIVSTDSWNRVTLVYNVNSKSWEIVDRASHSDLLYGRGCGVLINHNLIHWMIGEYLPDYYGVRPSRMVCFDVCTETWKDDILLPIHLYDPTSSTCFWEFGVLDGCLFTTFKNAVDSSTDIWMMKEYGVQESWTKLLTVSYSINLHGGVVPVAYRGGDSSEVLHRQRGKSKQVWYNLKDNTMKDAHVHNFWEKQPNICYESLISHPGAKLFGAYYESDETVEEQ